MAIYDPIYPNIDTTSVSANSKNHISLFPILVQLSNRSKYIPNRPSVTENNEMYTRGLHWQRGIDEVLIKDFFKTRGLNDNQLDRALEILNPFLIQMPISRELLGNFLGKLKADQELGRRLIGASVEGGFVDWMVAALFVAAIGVVLLRSCAPPGGWPDPPVSNSLDPNTNDPEDLDPDDPNAGNDPKEGSDSDELRPYDPPMIQNMLSVILKLIDQFL